MKVNIFIETGLSDEKRKSGQKTNEQHFIEQYASHVTCGANVNVIPVGGKDSLYMSKNEMAKNTDAGELNLVIFDCDYPTSGEESTREMIERVRKEAGMEFDYFLFPNNQDPGTFEDLLLHIINKKHECLLKCFEGYEGCIAGYNEGKDLYEIPNVKAKIYSYISSFKRSRSKTEKFKEGDWFFDDEEYWNLDDPYLEPLKAFLQKYL